LLSIGSHSNANFINWLWFSSVAISYRMLRQSMHP
jgi:hypothetical protein